MPYPVSSKGDEPSTHFADYHVQRGTDIPSTPAHKLRPSRYLGHVDDMNGNKVIGSFLCL